ncbi:hypothetical protein BKA56DRAFT_590871 [Ilyonectria sp. MPI-CAGE-AT-0026]|nr:hypothetical protein BKA56DRAFT_590871 [Ilyonectria sp. MPI-CAGE-AT-0026]
MLLGKPAKEGGESMSRLTRCAMHFQATSPFMKCVFLHGNIPARSQAPPPRKHRLVASPVHPWSSTLVH